MIEPIFGHQGKKVVVSDDGELLVGNERISREKTMEMLEGNFGKPRYLNFSDLVERVDLLLKKYEGEKPLKHYPTEQNNRDYHQKRN